MTPLISVPLITWPSFMNPGRLWVLAVLPLLLVLYLIALRLKGRTGIRFTNTGVLEKVLPRQSQWRRHVAVAMSLCSLIALSMAWARPLGLEKVPRERATVVVVIDVSLSMQATDVSPNRLDAAKKAAVAFIDSLPAEYNVAVVKLSGTPAIVMPPSLDRGATDRTVLALTLEDGTDIGEALLKSQVAIKEAPPGADKSVAPAMIVLLSDGTNTVGSIGAGVNAAVTAKTPVYTIAYGTSNGYVDVDGQRYRVEPDAAQLKSIADATHGKATDAKNAGQLKNAYKDIRSSVGYEDVRKERTAVYAMYALAFAVVAALGAVSMAARWP